MKKVLVLCTGNSCRSIMAEALINAYLSGVEAKSAGSSPKERVNPKTVEILKQEGIWKDEYRPKAIEEINEDFDLVITVCDRAKESCVVYKNALHIPFEDPDGKDTERFKKVFNKIKETLLPLVKKELLKRSVKTYEKGVFVSFNQMIEKEKLEHMVSNCKNGACDCMEEKTKKKIESIKIENKNGSLELKIEGDIEKEEIQNALEKSKILNER